LSKYDVANKGTNSHGQHNPPIVGHEQEHDEKAIKDLDSIESAFDECSLSFIS